MNNKLVFTDSTVTKHFRSRIAFDHELHVLQGLAGSGLVPKILHTGDMAVTMERIPGMTLREVPAADMQVTAEKILQSYITLQETYYMRESVYLIPEDLNPGNILLTDDRICWIDFEQYHTGTKEESLAVLCAMFATLSPALYLPGDSSVQALTEELVQKIQMRRTVMKDIRRSSCIVLAGGKSSRMQGYPKGLLELGEYTFMDHILYHVQIFDRISVSANTDDYDSFGYPVIPDIDDRIGPLGALHASLAQLDDSYLFVIPCDMPVLQTETILSMYTSIREADAVILGCGERIYPTVGIYRKEVLPVLEEQIRQKNFRMRSFLERLHVRYHMIDDPRQVLNINTPADLKDLQNSL